MKYIIPPTLLVGGFNDLNLLKFAHSKGQFDIDFMVYYEYQRKHLELLLSYIQPELYESFPAYETLEETIGFIENSIYKERYYYMLVSFLHHNEYDKDKIKDWLNNRKLFYHDGAVNVYRYYELKKVYQTVIVDLDVLDGNRWNRFYNLPPNLFTDDVIRNALDHLSVGGICVMLNGNVGRMYDFIAIGYEELEEGVYKKNEIKKIRRELPKREWL